MNLDGCNEDTLIYYFIAYGVFNLLTRICIKFDRSGYGLVCSLISLFTVLMGVRCLFLLGLNYIFNIITDFF